MVTITQLKIGDTVETTEKHDRDIGTHYHGTIDNIDSRNYNFIELFTDSGEMVTIHTKYIQKYEGED